MTVNHILTDLGFSKDIKVREEALESLTRRIAILLARLMEAATIPQIRECSWDFHWQIANIR